MAPTPPRRRRRGEVYELTAAAVDALRIVSDLSSERVLLSRITSHPDCRSRAAASNRSEPRRRVESEAHRRRNRTAHCRANPATRRRRTRTPIRRIDARGLHQPDGAHRPAPRRLQAGRRRHPLDARTKFSMTSAVIPVRSVRSSTNTWSGPATSSQHPKDERSKEHSGCSATKRSSNSSKRTSTSSSPTHSPRLSNPRISGCSSEP